LAAGAGALGGAGSSASSAQALDIYRRNARNAAAEGRRAASECRPLAGADAGMLWMRPRNNTRAFCVKKRRNSDALHRRRSESTCWRCSARADSGRRCSSASRRRGTLALSPPAHPGARGGRPPPRRAAAAAARSRAARSGRSSCSSAAERRLACGAFSEATTRARSFFPRVTRSRPRRVLSARVLSPAAGPAPRAPNAHARCSLHATRRRRAARCAMLGHLRGGASAPQPLSLTRERAASRAAPAAARR
jgi:hypothetical protein